MAICDNCGAKYSVTEYHSPMRDKDNFKCRYCQNILSEWNGSTVYEFKVISGPTKEYK